MQKIKGIDLTPRGKFRVRITGADGKLKYIGAYETEAEAKAALEASLKCTPKAVFTPQNTGIDEVLEELVEWAMERSAGNLQLKAPKLKHDE